MPPGRVLRFDMPRIHALLDARRVERGMTWAAVAVEIGGTTGASLARMGSGSRVSLPLVARIALRLDVPIAGLTRAAAR